MFWPVLDKPALFYLSFDCYCLHLGRAQKPTYFKKVIVRLQES